MNETNDDTKNIENNIYKLDLHETFITSESTNFHSLFTTVMRVPGGWIYRSFDKSSNIGFSSFVPHNNEFRYSE